MTELCEMKLEPERVESDADLRVRELEAQVDRLHQQLRWLSRHVLLLEHDHTMRRIQERVPWTTRIKGAWQASLRALRAFAEEWVERQDREQV